MCAKARRPLHAALLGARELVGPVIAMTITLAAVYAPIAFQGGLTGSLFREFALDAGRRGVHFRHCRADAVAGDVVPAARAPSARSTAWSGASTAISTGCSKFYGRVLDWHAGARGRRSIPSGSVLTLLTIPMFMMAGGQGTRAGGRSGRSCWALSRPPPDATIDQTTFYTDALARQLLTKCRRRSRSFNSPCPDNGFWRPGAQAVGRTEAHRFPDPAGGAGDGEQHSRHPHVHGHAVRRCRPAARIFR